MKWPLELERLKPLVKKYIIRYWLLSFLKGITMLAAINIPLRLMEGFIPSYGSVLLFTNIIAIGVLSYVFYKNRPDIKGIAQFLDTKLSGNERLATYLEYREDDSQMISLMKKEVKQYFEKSKLNIDWEMNDFKKQSLIAIAVIIAMVISSVFLQPLISESFQKDKFVEEKKQEAIQEIDEVLDEIKELDKEVYQDLTEQLELLKDLIDKAVDQEEIEMLLREMQELLLEKKETLEEMQESLKSVQELLNSHDDIAQEINENPLLQEEILEKIEELQKLPMDSDTKEKLEGLKEAIQQGATENDMQQLKDLLTDLESSLSPNPLESLIDPNENPGNGQNGDPNEQPGNGGEGGENGNGENPGTSPGEGEGEGEGNGEGGESNEPGQGSSPTGGNQKTPQDFTFIPKDKEVKLDGINTDGYTLKDIMKFNPELTNTPYNNVFREYQREAVTSINRNGVPKPLEDYVREYFRSIAP